MSHARLTTSVLARLAAAGPSGRPRTPTSANILISFPLQRPCASYAKPRARAMGGGIPTAGARSWLANTTTPASRPSTKRQPNSNTHHDGGGGSSSQPTGGAPTPDAFSFKSLGMTPGVRVVVYTALGIFGTMETILWIKVFWRWWTGKGEEDEPQA
ncbi:hypothetical protein F4775DRAFT_206600 [Biscogniauxia sp. FL1348]|nr:hypothetical protein F4775DRAFT_206600 [Biscogniauxia sp. FL1348]